MWWKLSICVGCVTIANGCTEPAPDPEASDDGALAHARGAATVLLDRTSEAYAEASHTDDCRFLGVELEGRAEWHHAPGEPPTSDIFGAAFLYGFDTCAGTSLAGSVLVADAYQGNLGHAEVAVSFDATVYAGDGTAIDSLAVELSGVFTGTGEVTRERHRSTIGDCPDCTRVVEVTSRRAADVAFALVLDGELVELTPNQPGRLETFTRHAIQR